ncbi:hypothetical protein DFH09DRAFT_1084890 [Mycena vulgaris]|nr:hypothetical protein DFH09DRAFT_1084890 [Mycena vulgaris]
MGVSSHDLEGAGAMAKGAGVQRRGATGGARAALGMPGRDGGVEGWEAFEEEGRRECVHVACDLGTAWECFKRLAERLRTSLKPFKENDYYINSDCKELPFIEKNGSVRTTDVAWERLRDSGLRKDEAGIRVRGAHVAWAEHGAAHKSQLVLPVTGLREAGSVVSLRGKRGLLLSARKNMWLCCPMPTAINNLNFCHQYRSGSRHPRDFYAAKATTHSCANLASRTDPSLIEVDWEAEGYCGVGAGVNRKLLSDPLLLPEAAGDIKIRGFGSNPSHVSERVKASSSRRSGQLTEDHIGRFGAALEELVEGGMKLEIESNKLEDLGWEQFAGYLSHPMISVHKLFFPKMIFPTRRVGLEIK